MTTPFSTVDSLEIAKAVDFPTLTDCGVFLLTKALNEAAARALENFAPKSSEQIVWQRLFDAIAEYRAAATKEG